MTDWHGAILHAAGERAAADRVAHEHAAGYNPAFLTRGGSMRCLPFVCALLVGATASPALARQGNGSGYLTPPKDIVDILEAEPLPTVVPSPDRRTLAVFRREPMPSIAELAQPMYRVGGGRLNPRTSGPHRLPGLVALTLKAIDGTERPVTLPKGSKLMTIGFSHDGSKLAFSNVRDRGIELWIADARTGQAKAVTGPALNATMGTPCEWLDNDAELLCTFVPDGRGAEPREPPVPAGPNVQENAGKAAPVATYEDLNRNAHDDDLFEHYTTSQLEYVDAKTGKRTPVGKPGIVDEFAPSPDGRYLLLATLKRPFSRLLPANGYPKHVAILDRSGAAVKTIADLPSAEGVPILGVLPGPRSYQWNKAEQATAVWVEALDGGNPRNEVRFRDRIVALQAPFAGEPTELAKTEYRYRRIAWTEKGVGLLTEYDRPKRWTRTWIIDRAGAPPRKLWDRSDEDRYGDPGQPLTVSAAPGPAFGGGPSGLVVQRGDDVFLKGDGASPEGDRPFLDRLNLKTLATQRLFRSNADSYEYVVAVLSDDGKKVLTRYEARTEPPNYYVRDLNGDARQAITAFRDPHPEITKALATREFVTYERSDGVKLSGTIYLPTTYEKGDRVPLFVWAYPREFADPGAASQVVGSPNRFTTVSGASHLLLLTQGYAIFDGPTMPIVGKGETANNTYVDQLVASAQAAVDKAVDMGIADRNRVAVGGHSYGAFMTANLLAHSDIFRAGIARSGAYNRTLTPFGFQNERRTFWEVPQVYSHMSPFFYADKINEPILLIHGEMDDNSGTFPIQSERLFMALKGHGATVRYVTLPYEAHGYAARESILDTVSEMLNWLDKWVKNAPPRPTTTAAK
jgi:dipeptidyl aminopeptidase/acylaminoacyl peptidase